LWLVLLAAPVFAGDISGIAKIQDRRGKNINLIKDPAVVYLVGKAPIPDKLRNANYIMSTKNKQFSPRLMIVPKGAEVLFPNNDPIIHNVFSVSGKNRFDGGRYGKGEGATHRFQYPGMVRIYCNVHHQMNAVIFITDNPWFAYVAESGSFRIKDVPPGQYKITLLHRLAGNTTRDVVVSQGADLNIELSLQAKQKRLKPHLNKDGKPYKRRRSSKY
jgi:plastocyanin